MTEIHGTSVAGVGAVVSEISSTLPAEELVVIERCTAAAQELLVAAGVEMPLPGLATARESLHRGVGSLGTATGELQDYLTSIGLGPSGNTTAAQPSVSAASGTAESQPEMAERIEKITGRLKASERKMGLLMKLLAGPIIAGRWGSLLIEGRSGQFPGFMVGTMMQRHDKEHGQPVRPVLSVASGRSSNAEEATERAQAIEDYVEGIKSTFGGRRVLLLTEYLRTGWSLVPVATALYDAGIAFDIAAVEGDDSGEGYLEGFKREFPVTFSDVQIFVGEDSLRDGSGGGLAFYDAMEPDLKLATGVKAEGTNPVLQPHLGPDHPLVAAAYAEAGALADKLYDRFFKAGES